MTDVIGKVKIIRRASQVAVWALAQNSSARTMLNRYYLTLNPFEAATFYERYAKIFRILPPRSFSVGQWIVRFNQNSIKMPLRHETMWLDWDAALSIIGHDLDIKKTYAALISSEERPNLLIDIGANYGTHSVLFLSNDIPTISFEPNSACLNYFRSICLLNELKPRWEPIALGSCNGSTDLFFPERETWLGSISLNVIENMKSNGAFHSETVRMSTLDDYMDRNVEFKGERKILIKIDVEDAEIDVLMGAKKTIVERQPKIIFESNNRIRRHELAQFLSAFRYEIFSLPWGELSQNEPLIQEAFIQSPMTNFIAIPGRGP